MRRRTSVLGWTASVAVSLGSAAGGPIDLFENGEFEAARDAYESRIPNTTNQHERAASHFGAGSSAYRAEEYDQALEHFAQALLSDDTSLQEHAHYNLGNTLFRRGQKFLELEKPEMELAAAEWQSAVDQYEEALAIHSTNKNTVFNRDFVKGLLQQLKQQIAMKQKQDQQQPSPGGEGGEPMPDGENGRDPDGKGGEGERQQAGGNDNPDQEGGAGGEKEDPTEQEGLGDDGKEREGRLRAEGDQDQDGQGDGENQESAESNGESEVNQNTGFSPAAARKLLEKYADDDKTVHPNKLIRRPPPDKDW